MSFKQNRFPPVLLSLFSGLIFCFSWHPVGFPFLLFFAFVPLFLLQDQCMEISASSGGLKIFGYSFLTFFIWNAGTTWWIFNATSFGSVAAFVFNSLFMASVFWLFHVLRKKSPKMSVFIFPVLWISFEYLHLCWELSWPWLTLGNSFGAYPGCIQWYEFTGVLGGSLWILLINILLFVYLKSFQKFSFAGFRSRSFIVLISIILGPLILSLYMYSTYQETNKPVSVVIVQPNVDPYSEKFSSSPEAMVQELLKQSSTLTNSSTDFLICPETAVPSGIWENVLAEDTNIVMLKNYMKVCPRLKIICGISSYRKYEEAGRPTLTARKFPDGIAWYDAYNTAVLIDSTPEIQVYHKSKLVPGVEQMPYPGLFGFLEYFTIDLGGISGSLGTQKDRINFHSNKAEIAPVICYESVYGDFLSSYIRNGAEFIAIITNDGWWGDTPGYKQHLLTGRLRAIEFRRSIARSANTGISCFINQRGDISQATDYWKPAVIKGLINRNSELTFYAKHGDYLGILSSVLFLLLIVSVLFLNLFRRKSFALKS